MQVNHDPIRYAIIEYFKKKKIMLAAQVKDRKIGLT